MTPLRAERLRRAVADGVRRSPHASFGAPVHAPIGPQGSSVVRPMPRRKVTHSIASAPVQLPRARRVVFKPGIIRPILRLFAWIWGAIRFFSGNSWDIILRRHSMPRRAARLRRVFEDTGASLAKLAQ